MTAPWPYYDDDERAAAGATLASGKVNYWTGQEGRRFEAEFAERFGLGHAVALANGTVALDLCWHVLDLEPGSEVVVSPRTFVASVSSIVLAGLTPVFADVDCDSGNITAESIERVLSDRTRAVLCVHLGGWPCAMNEICELARKHSLMVVEDCAQAHGAKIGGRWVGSFGNVSAWSFCQDKIISTGGEGGMFSTSDSKLWEKAWSFKDHGKSWEAVYNREQAPGFRWVHESFGTNWRMTEFQAAIGRVQLGKLDGWVQRRRENARLLAEALDCRFLRVPIDVDSAFYRLYVYVVPDSLPPGWTRDRIMSEVNRAGVPCFTGTCGEVYLEKAFDGTLFRPAERLQIARELAETSLCFLTHPTLTEDGVRDQCTALRRALSRVHWRLVEVR